MLSFVNRPSRRNIVKELLKNKTFIPKLQMLLLSVMARNFWLLSIILVISNSSANLRFRKESSSSMLFIKHPFFHDTCSEISGWGGSILCDRRFCLSTLYQKNSPNSCTVVTKVPNKPNPPSCTCECVCI